MTSAIPWKGKQAGAPAKRGHCRMGWSIGIRADVLTTHTGSRMIFVRRHRTVTFFGRARKRGRPANEKMELDFDVA
jgi:hypothetical protein